ncbi:hypothetical protein G3578_09230 [Brevibacillus sp. SYP-B805]|uniref:hypothetical protein n=1 Tax=Brevibacillus sp. SYP-B805 TaxID=1578199 RepID=UPI0013ECFA91|nr:hypothetical protein [Brevibacillus sp. SYP-B805]NGQ95336.1 hypothetical protein [Brevibacillus sp. SYP-B805]
MDTKIARKWLCNWESVPKGMNLQDCLSIIQNYLMASDMEVRILKQTSLKTGEEKFFVSIRSEMGLVRQETEVEIAEGTFEWLYAITGTNALLKDRFVIQEETVGEFNVDMYYDQKLNIIGKEFPDAETAKQFIPPAWFGEEVTDNSKFKAQSLWKELNGVEF